MARPNLFAYATTELSQDAFFCWLLDWANTENADGDCALQHVACGFLNALLAKHNKPSVTAPKVKVHRQYERVDIVVVVNDHFVLTIEDKIGAGVHGDQLNRYPDRIRKKFPTAEILPVFLKTVDQSNYRNVEQEGYKLFLRSDILTVLRTSASEISNAIFVDFLDNLEKLEVSIASYRTTQAPQWTKEWNPWIGFYGELQQRRSDLQWGYVANRSGGFLGAWWHLNQRNGCDLYLQVEQSRLCFKIAPNDTDGGRRRALRDSWYKKLQIASQRQQYPYLHKPHRFRLGAWMTVAVIELTNWMATRADGILDWDLTMQNISEIERVLDEAVRL